MSEPGDIAFGAPLTDPVRGSGDVTSPSRSHRRLIRALVVLVVVLLAAAGVAARWMVSEYAITPGTALNVSTLISVPKEDSHGHAGRVILTDVELTQLSALGYAYYYLRNRSEIIGAAQLTGGQSSSEYNEEGVIDMATARQAAAFVALRTLGYHPKAVADGVVVYAIEPGASSKSTPAVGDVVTAVAGRPSAQLQPLEAAVGAVPPGTAIALTFHLLGSTHSTTKSYVVGELRTVGKGSAIQRECLSTSSHAGTLVLAQGRPESCLPFYPEQLYRDTDEPFPVSISANGIVGPSAGLSFTLGVIEKLDSADLTGGHKVAATGTISNDGSVGAVGGVAEKTIAVRAAGASVFLVPAGQNYAAARANAGPNLEVIAVSSIGQAVSALERLGGRLAAATSR